MSNLFNPLRPLGQQIKYKIGKYPTIFYPVFSFIPQFPELSVNSTTELVIEGFPRSANTYCVLAFEHIQPVKIKIAHHLHVPCQILRGIKLRIPIMLLIRNPKDVTISYSIHYPNVPIEQILRQYIDYYSFLYDYQSAYSIARFEDVTNNFESIIDELNLKFGTNFASRKISSQEDKYIFDKIRQLYTSSSTEKQRKIEEQRIIYIADRKNILKQEIRSKLEGEKYKLLLENAESVYQRYVLPKAAI